MEKKSLLKRIAAIAASAFLVFARSETQALGAPLQEQKTPVQNELNINNTELEALGNHYSDLGIIGEDMLSLEDVLHTKVSGEICDTMVPQGLTEVDDLFLVTAYDGIHDYKKELKLYSYDSKYKEKLKVESNHKPHNSVIYAFDKNTKKLLATMELEDRNHVGGIAADDKNVYIAKSKDKKVSVISLDKIKEAAEAGRKAGNDVRKIKYDRELDCDGVASFITTRQDVDGKYQLAVGTWSLNSKESKIRLYDMEENGNISLNQEIPIQESANGAEFVRRAGQEYLLVSTSYGRTFSSRLFVNQVYKNINGMLQTNEKTSIELPPMAEEVVAYTGKNGDMKIAIGTESLSNRYEIGRPKIYSKGIVMADLGRLVNMPNKNLPRTLDKPGIPTSDEIRSREDDGKGIEI